MAPKARKHIVLQDLDMLKARKAEVKKQLQELSKTVKIQAQRKRRLLRKASGLENEDLLWLIKERENLAKNQETAKASNPGENADSK